MYIRGGGGVLFVNFFFAFDILNESVLLYGPGIDDSVSVYSEKRRIILIFYCLKF